MSNLGWKKEKLGEVPVSHGLYTTKASQKIYMGAAKAEQVLTMEEIHAQLCHIVPEAIHCMLKEGTITGITLDGAHKMLAACGGLKDKVIDLLCLKIKARVYEPYQSPYQSQQFCTWIKAKQKLQIVHDLQPLGCFNES